MRNERKKQIMTFSILVVAVLVISVGFAAFSTTLRINSSATVNPDASSFSVKFSTTKDTLTVAEVKPSSVTSGLTTTNGAIDNSSSPTISNLSAEFVNPGDYVEYTFYARNEGEYTAYLNNINFNGTKTCEAGEGATTSLVTDACNSISMTVSVAGTSYSATTPITGHTLAKKTGEEVKVRIEYASTGAVADGPFTVTLPQITMVYSSVDDSTIAPSTGVCTLTDSDSSGGASLSDVVTCGTESFYVMSADSTNNTVTMLAKYNLEVGYVGDSDGTEYTKGIQSEDVNGVYTGYLLFSDAMYWDTSSINYSGYYCDEAYQGSYSPAGDSVYPYVYDSNSNLYQYVEAYETYLKTNGVSSANATIMSLEQAQSLVGCSYNGCNMWDMICSDFSAVTPWAYSTQYWLGSAISRGMMAIVTPTKLSGADSAGIYPPTAGIRPVVTISTSDIQ